MRVGMSPICLPSLHSPTSSSPSFILFVCYGDIRSHCPNCNPPNLKMIWLTRCEAIAWECHTSEDCRVLDKCADKECGCHSKNPLLKEIFFRRRPIRLICIFCRQPLRTRVRHCKWLHWDWSPLLLHWWLLLYLWTICLFFWERPSYNWPQVTTFSGAFPWWWDAENYRNYDSTSGEMGTLRR